MEVVETLILGHGNEDEKMSVVMCYMLHDGSELRSCRDLEWDGK